MIDQEAAAVLARENAGKAPGRVRQRPQIEQIDHQQVARFRPFDPERPAEIMDLGQVDIADIVGAVVVPDLPAGPVVAFDPELVARFEHLDHGQVRMPPVMGLDVRLFRRPR
jgi:hypothetical protein